MTKRKLVLLGSTGSIGTQCLDIVDKYPDRLEIYGLAAGGGNIDLLLKQAIRYRPREIAVYHGNEAELANLFKAHGIDAQVHVGSKGMATIAGLLDADGIVLNGINGGVGLEPTLAALKSGATLALANKESLVVGAPLVKAACVRPGQIIPVDSEHSAIAQCLLSGRHKKGLTVPEVDGTSEVAQLILTASGGPFRGKTRADLAKVNAKEALQHPTWSMGPVVTVNSSTLMNKGLELIEAHVLFDIAPQDIKAVVHPQSIVHSMVTFKDGATIVQASPPSMHLPIALSLSWPQRWDDIEPACEWEMPTSWDFEPVDNITFPALDLARYCIEQSHTHPAVMNAANEVAVDAFLKEKLPYLAILDTVTEIVSRHEGINQPTLEETLQVQEWAVALATEVVNKAVVTV